METETMIKKLYRIQKEYQDVIIYNDLNINISEMCRDVIAKLIELSEPQWISVEKSLPIKTGSYFVTKINKRFHKEEEFILDSSTEIFWTTDGKWDCERDPECEWEVIAWTEKPKPYKPKNIKEE